MSKSSEDLPERDRPVQSKSSFGHPDWFTRNWKAGLAFIYSIVVLVDFVIFPIYVGYVRMDTVKLIMSITDLTPDTRAELIKTVMKPYAPKSLIGGGMLHLSFGALLTGATIQSKLR